MPIDDYLGKIESSDNSQITQKIKENKVTYYETPAYKIAEYLKSKSYIIGNSCGRRVEEPDPDAITILKPRDPIPKNFLGIKWKQKQYAFDLGTLWISNQARNAVSNSKWVLEANGRENIEELIILMKDLSKPFHVNIEIQLVSEGSQYERSSSDDSGG